MGVIYLDPKPNKWADVGQGLQAIGGFVQRLQAARQAKQEQTASAQIAQIQDPQQMAAAAYKMLPTDKASSLVQGLLKARTENYMGMKAQADARKADSEAKLDDERLQEMPQEFQLKRKANEAETNLRFAQAHEASARAAGVSSEIAKNEAEAGKYRVEAEVARHGLAASQAYSDAILKQLGSDNPQPVTAQGAPGKPPVTVTAAHAQDLVDLAVGKKSLSEVSLPAYQPKQSSNPYHLTPAQVPLFKQAVASGNPNEVAKITDEANKFVSKSQVMVAPGIYQEVGVRSDGSEQNLGNPRDMRGSKGHTLSSKDTEDTEGVVDWMNTINKMEADFKAGLGSQGRRSVEGLGQAMHLPVGSEKVADFKAAADHAFIVATKLLGSRSNKFQQISLGNTLPTLSTPDTVFQSKLDASRSLGFTFLKSQVETLASEGKVVPKPIQDFYNQYNLSNVSWAQLDPNAKALGKGGKTAASSGGEGSPAAAREGAATTPPAGASPGSTASGDAPKSVVVGGRQFSADFIQEQAQKYGMTPGEIVEGLKNAAGQP